MEIKTVRDLMTALYTSFGNYPAYFITEAGSTLSRRGVLLGLATEARFVRDGESVDRVIAMEVNWENPALFCDETGDRIESAY